MPDCLIAFYLQQNFRNWGKFSRKPGAHVSTKSSTYFDASQHAPRDHTEKEECSFWKVWRWITWKGHNICKGNIRKLNKTRYFVTDTYRNGAQQTKKYADLIILLLWSTFKFATIHKIQFPCFKYPPPLSFKKLFTHCVSVCVYYQSVFIHVVWRVPLLITSIITAGFSNIPARLACHWISLWVLAGFGSSRRGNPGKQKAQQPRNFVAIEVP